jgi:hypothetical protein
MEDGDGEGALGIEPALLSLNGPAKAAVENTKVTDSADTARQNLFIYIII